MLVTHNKEKLVDEFFNLLLLTKEDGYIDRNCWESFIQQSLEGVMYVEFVEGVNLFWFNQIDWNVTKIAIQLYLVRKMEGGK